jgi:DNA-binding CsgD family transcriptional regulator
MADLIMLAFHYHLAVMDLELGEKASLPSLSPREIETLKWAAAGKSAWETGRILSISARTVECYLRNAEVKLRATNKAQAVAVATTRDLLR